MSLHMDPIETDRQVTVDIVDGEVQVDVNKTIRCDDSAIDSWLNEQYSLLNVKSRHQSFSDRSAAGSRSRKASDGSSTQSPLHSISLALPASDTWQFQEVVANMPIDLAGDQRPSNTEEESMATASDRRNIVFTHVDGFVMQDMTRTDAKNVRLGQSRKSIVNVKCGDTVHEDDMSVDQSSSMEGAAPGGQGRHQATVAELEQLMRASSAPADAERVYSLEFETACDRARSHSLPSYRCMFKYMRL